MRQAVRALRRELQRKRLALTSVSGRDEKGLETVARALRQGRDELFKWAVGPALDRGDLVGLYIPTTVPAGVGPVSRIRGSVTHLYAVAGMGRSRHQPEIGRGRGADATRWNWEVWLERRLSLPSPVRFATLEESVLCPNRAPVNRWLQQVGKETWPLDADEVRRFWSCVLGSNGAHADLIRQRLLPRASRAGSRYDVGLSYSRETMVEAQQLSQQCADHGVQVFFNETATKGLSSHDREWMKRHLGRVYGRETDHNVVLWSRDYPRRFWTRFELEIMHRARAGRRTPLTIVTMPGSRGPRGGGPSRTLQWSEYGAYGVVREVLRGSRGGAVAP